VFLMIDHPQFFNFLNQHRILVKNITMTIFTNNGSKVFCNFFYCYISWNLDIFWAHANYAKFKVFYKFLPCLLLKAQGCGGGKKSTSCELGFIIFSRKLQITKLTLKKIKCTQQW
jgi:hypothetical protein